MKKNLNQDLPYSDTNNIAESRYQKYKSKDPFPSIKPALLNSADIADYVAQVGMIFPFNPSQLGPASYEMLLGGESLNWDEKDKTNNQKIEKGDPLVLRKNSITYVSVQETFRIPDYIGLRFNLRVKHVHRGLLLGTGPLIDPGFNGKIMIPIHNLTSNEYVIHGGDDLISVEFTKVSPNDAWKVYTEDIFERLGKFKANSGKNSNKSFGELLKKSLPIGLGRVVSSLSGTLADADESIKKGRLQIDNNERLLSNYRKISIFAGVTLTIALIALFFTTYSVVSDANKYVADASMLIKKCEQDDVDIRNFVVRDEVNLMKVNVDKLKKQLTKLKKENAKLYRELMLRPRGNIDVSCPVVCDETNSKVESNGKSAN